MAELVGQPRRLRLERCDHGLVDGGGALAFEIAAPFGQHGGQTLCPLAQRLEADKGIADVVTAHRRELRLRGDDCGVELRQAGLQS